MASKYVNKRNLEVRKLSALYEVEVGEDMNPVIVKFMTENKDSPYYHPEEKYTMHIELVHNRGFYPLNPPNITFLDKIFHPNISTKGSICMTTLTDPSTWTPANTLEAVVISIISLLDDPNPNSALNGEARGDLKDPKYIEKIKNNTKFYKDMEGMPKLKTTPFVPPVIVKKDVASSSKAPE